MTVKSLSRSSLENNVFYRSMLAGNPGEQEGAVLLQEIVLASDQTSITFSNLAQYASQYRHLQIRVVGRTLRVGGTDDGLQLTFNNTSNAAWLHYLVGNGSNVRSENGNDIMQVAAYTMTAINSAANSFGAAIINVFDAFEAKNKTIMSLSGKTGDTPVISLQSTAWYNTAVTNEIKIDARNGNFGFAAKTRMSIYGFRG